MARDSFSAGTRNKGGIGFRPQMVRGVSVPRLIPNVRVESSLVNEIDALGQMWRKPSPMGNRRSPIQRRSPTGHQLKGITRPIPDHNITLAETWRLAGCRHDQQQALLRWWDLKRINVPFHCLQRSLGYGRICCVGRGFGPACQRPSRAVGGSLLAPRFECSGHRCTENRQRKGWPQRSMLHQRLSSTSSGRIGNDPQF